MSKVCPTVEEISVKQNKAYARECFEGKYPKRKERETHKEILSEVLYQIRICEELKRPVSKEIIRCWIDTCNNELQVERKARTHKFGKLVA